MTPAIAKDHRHQGVHAAQDKRNQPDVKDDPPCLVRLQDFTQPALVGFLLAVRVINPVDLAEMADFRYEDIVLARLDLLQHIANYDRGLDIRQASHQLIMARWI